MKQFLSICGIFLLISGGVAAQNGSAALQDLRVDVIYLSSDFMQGRETGTESERLAAQYIASRFEEAGLSPKGDNGSYFQEFAAVVKSNPHAESGENRTARNVIGFINNKAAQTVVIGAHYDHLGHGISGSLYTGEPAIHNGADDNASGVAGLLRLATMLKEKGPKKSNYLFIAFSGEELGLYGSKYFVDHPTLEWQKINYMLNMDMIGRLDSAGVLLVNGVGTSPSWPEVMATIKVDGLTIKTSEGGMGPSDHASFYLNERPVLHFFTGQHSDYHKPSDDSELINYEGIESVTRYIFDLIVGLDKKGRLEFTKTVDENEGRQAARFKVSLGVMPDYVFQGEGLRIDGVTDGRPAQVAGLQRGDILIQIGDMPVKDIYDYMEGLGLYEKGQTTKVIILRGTERLEKEVTF
ncbi:MAG: M20/M25/M40 family metallo-hydrolase [Saprospirales bacterium]|nr:M20/M25/M40 family metallo-hydrolase [Saprospirales bacterium]